MSQRICAVLKIALVTTKIALMYTDSFLSGYKVAHRRLPQAQPADPLLQLEAQGDQHLPGRPTEGFRVLRDLRGTKRTLEATHFPSFRITPGKRRYASKMTL